MNKHKICRVVATAIITAVIIAVIAFCIFNPLNITLPLIRAEDVQFVAFVVFCTAVITIVCIGSSCAILTGNDTTLAVFISIACTAVAVVMFVIAAYGETTAFPEQQIALYMFSSYAIALIVSSVGSTLYKHASKRICRIVFRERSG